MAQSFRSEGSVNTSDAV